jgi:peptidyl-prolyl cis-trans isomerase C
MAPRKLAALAGAAALAVGVSMSYAQAPAPAPQAAPPAAPQAPAGKPAVVVNGEPIVASEVNSVVDIVIKQRFKTQPPTDAQRREIWMEVVTMLVDDALLRQYLNKSNIQVPQVEVDRQFAELKTSLEKNNRKLEDFYKETGQTEAQIKTSLLNMLRWAEHVKARLKEEDVKRYYMDNKDFFDRVTVHAAHILMRLPANASEADKQAARQKLTAIKVEIVAGRLDFAAAAKQYSQCSSAPNGGDIGFIPRKMLVDEAFAKVAFALKQNEVSDVVQTDAGLHIIKCLERKAGEATDYEKTKDDVRDFYVDELRQGIIAQERRSAKIEY